MVEELRKRGRAAAIAGLVLIAPAPDFTTELIEPQLTRKQKRRLAERGYFEEPSAYSAEPNVYTKALFDDGGRNRVLTGPIDTHCPVHILQGLADPDVPASHALKLASHLPADDLTVSLIPDGDHRLSRPQDLEMIIGAVGRDGRRERREHALIDPRFGLRRGDRRLWRHAGADHRRRQCGRRHADQTASWVTAICLAHGARDRVAELAHANAGHRGVVDAGRGTGRRPAPASPWATPSAPSSSWRCC